MASDFAQAPTPVLTLNSFPKGDAIVVECKGKILSGTAGELHSEVKALLPRTKHVILDLTSVTQMDSSGLGAIVGLYISAKSAGCRLELINLSKRIRELMSLTNLLLLFEQCGEHNVRVG
jgi:anti-sigma B factor antagonist